MVEMPKPIVVRYVQGIFKIRQGRGFSEAELREAGISASRARKLSIRVDPRRKTKLDENIKMLKRLLEGSNRLSHRKPRRRTSRRSSH